MQENSVTEYQLVAIIKELDAILKNPRFISLFPNQDCVPAIIHSAISILNNIINRENELLILNEKHRVHSLIKASGGTKTINEFIEYISNHDVNDSRIPKFQIQYLKDRFLEESLVLIDINQAIDNNATANNETKQIAKAIIKWLSLENAPLSEIPQIALKLQDKTFIEALFSNVLASTRHINPDISSFDLKKVFLKQIPEHATWYKKIQRMQTAYPNFDLFRNIYQLTQFVDEQDIPWKQKALTINEDCLKATYICREQLLHLGLSDELNEENFRSSVSQQDASTQRKWARNLLSNGYNPVQLRKHFFSENILKEFGYSSKELNQGHKPLATLINLSELLYLGSDDINRDNQLKSIALELWEDINYSLKCIERSIDLSENLYSFIQSRLYYGIAMFTITGIALVLSLFFLGLANLPLILITSYIITCTLIAALVFFASKDELEDFKTIHEDVFTEQLSNLSHVIPENDFANESQNQIGVLLNRSAIKINYIENISIRIFKALTISSLVGCAILVSCFGLYFVPLYTAGVLAGSLYTLTTIISATLIYKAFSSLTETRNIQRDVMSQSIKNDVQFIDGDSKTMTSNKNQENPFFKSISKDLDNVMKMLWNEIWAIVTSNESLDSLISRVSQKRNSESATTALMTGAFAHTFHILNQFQEDTQPKLKNRWDAVRTHLNESITQTAFSRKALSITNLVNNALDKELFTPMAFMIDLVSIFTKYFVESHLDETHLQAYLFSINQLIDQDLQIDKSIIEYLLDENCQTHWVDALFAALNHSTRNLDKNPAKHLIVKNLRSIINKIENNTEARRDLRNWIEFVIHLLDYICVSLNKEHPNHEAIHHHLRHVSQALHDYHMIEEGVETFNGIYKNLVEKKFSSMLASITLFSLTIIITSIAISCNLSALGILGLILIGIILMSSGYKLSARITTFLRPKQKLGSPEDFGPITQKVNNAENTNAFFLTKLVSNRVSMIEEAKDTIKNHLRIFLGFSFIILFTTMLFSLIATQSFSLFMVLPLCFIFLNLIIDYVVDYLWSIKYLVPNSPLDLLNPVSSNQIPQRAVLGRVSVISENESSSASSPLQPR